MTLKRMSERQNCKHCYSLVHLQSSPSMLESDGGVQPSILRLGGIMEETDDVTDSFSVLSSIGCRCCMYSDGMELQEDNARFN